MTGTNDLERLMLSMILQQYFVERDEGWWEDHTECRSARQTPKTMSYGVRRTAAHYMARCTYQLKYRRKQDILFSSYLRSFLATAFSVSAFFRHHHSVSNVRHLWWLVTNSPVLLDWTNSPGSMVLTNPPMLRTWAGWSNCVPEHQEDSSVAHRFCD
jgi:hypothetical protein